MKHQYTPAEVKKMLRGVKTDGLVPPRYDFHELQRVILQSQRERLQALLKDGTLEKERGPRVPFQNEAGAILMSTVANKKKLNPQEEQFAKEKRLAKYCTLIASMEDQNLSNQLATNNMIARPLGDVR